jgi:hypothetical protein
MIPAVAGMPCTTPVFQNLNGGIGQENVLTYRGGCYGDLARIESDGSVFLRTELHPGLSTHPRPYASPCILGYLETTYRQMNFCGFFAFQTEFFVA